MSIRCQKWEGRTQKKFGEEGERGDRSESLANAAGRGGAAPDERQTWPSGKGGKRVTHPRVFDPIVKAPTLYTKA
jgi:hypothetical protein